MTILRFLHILPIKAAVNYYHYCKFSSEEDHAIEMGEEENEMGDDELKDLMSLYLLKKRSANDPYLDNYYNDGMNGIKSNFFNSIPFFHKLSLKNVS